METLRILHIASFIGNIGDNANHSGTRARLIKNFKDFNLQFTELEIRQFYANWNIKQFDTEFIKYANGFPTVFYGIGFDPIKGYTENSLAKFKKFLDYTLQEDRFLVSLRNDGSAKHMKNLLGQKYVDEVYTVPDGGFFTVVKNHQHPELFNDKINITINLAGDMLEKRYNSEEKNNLSFDQFIAQFTKYFTKLLMLHKDIHLVLLPHIHKDLIAISAFLNNMDDRLSRTRIHIAPLLSGESGQAYIFDLYSKSNLVIGNRFHANVCAIGLGVPSIGLVNYPKIQDLYEELDMLDRVVTINHPDFVEKLDFLVRESLSQPNAVKARYEKINKNLSIKKDNFQQTMYSFLKKIQHSNS